VDKINRQIRFILSPRPPRRGSNAGLYSASRGNGACLLHENATNKSTTFGKHNLSLPSFGYASRIAPPGEPCCRPAGKQPSESERRYCLSAATGEMSIGSGPASNDRPLRVVCPIARSATGGDNYVTYGEVEATART